MERSGALPSAGTTDGFARKLFGELQQAIIQYELQAKSGDVEAVHDMRVGIRRMRVMLSNFAVCIPKKDRQRLRLSVKKMADALGGVRDLDVMIESLKASQKSQTSEVRSAIANFIRQLRAKRRSRLKRLAAYLNSEEYAAFKREFLPAGENDISNSGDEQNEQAA